MRCTDDGIVRLWCAVILRAVADMDDPIHRLGARDFVYSDDPRVLGFVWLCDTLGLDANRIRRLCKTREGRAVLRGRKIREVA